MLPDIDSVAGILMGDFGRFHNNWTHSLIFGLVVSLVIGGAVWLKLGMGFLRWFITTLVCYQLHVIMDFFTLGRGVMILWPFSSERYASPVILFYGLHWSEGWVNPRHLWTIGTELGGVALIGLVLYLRTKKK